MSIDPEIQQRAEEADQLKHNGVWRSMLEGLVESIQDEWAAEDDAEKREALWRDLRAVWRLEEEINARLGRLAMEARKAERKK